MLKHQCSVRDFRGAGRDSASLRSRYLDAARGGPGKALNHSCGLTAAWLFPASDVIQASLAAAGYQNSWLLLQPAVVQQLAERTRIVNLVQSPLGGSEKHL